MGDTKRFFEGDTEICSVCRHCIDGEHDRTDVPRDTKCDECLYQGETGYVEPDRYDGIEKRSEKMEDMITRAHIDAMERATLCNYGGEACMRGEAEIDGETYAIYFGLESGQAIDDPDIYSTDNICSISRL